MYTRQLSFALLVAFVSATSIATAQTATPVPDLKADFSPMTFMLGTWNCRTTKNSSGRAAGRTETDTNTMILDGHYMQTDSVSKPFDAARTKDVVGHGWIGYDTAAKQWFSFGVSNFGGFGMSTSPGWSGNTIVWTDKYQTDGQPLGVTTTTKVSDTKMTDSTVTKSAQGNETTQDECTKA